MKGDTGKRFTAEVKDVFSGDDLVVMVDLKVDDLWKRRRVRLHGVDTPNAVRAGPETPAGQLRAYVKNLCQGRELEIEVVSQGAAGWVVKAWVLLPTGPHNLNEDLCGQGYAYQREKNL